VQWLVDGSDDGSPVPVNGNGIASLGPVSGLGTGSHTVEADFSDAGVYAASSQQITLDVGQATPGATLLTKVACEAMVGKRSHVSIFGTDYPTPDGTGVRDYLHVEDLAAAHLRALDYLRSSGRSVTLNVGYGHGYSVREVLAMVESVGGKQLVIREEPRRAGDPAYLVARADRIRTELGWQPRYDDLRAIVSSALAWEQKLTRDPWT